MCDSPLFTAIVTEQIRHVHIRGSIKLEDVILAGLQKVYIGSYAISDFVDNTTVPRL